MFSKRFYTVSAFLFNVSQYIGSLPYWKLDTVSHKFLQSEYTLQKFKGTYFCFTLWVIYGIYKTSIRLLNKDLNGFSLLYGLTIASVVLFLGFTLFIAFSESFRICINRVLYIFTYLHDEYMPSYDPNKEWRGILIDIGAMLIFIGLITMSFMTIGIFVARPRLPLLIGSAIPPKYFILPVQIVTTALQLYLIYSAYSSAAFAALIVYEYFVSLAPFVAQELCLGRKSYRTLNTLRQPAELVRIYRTLQLINTHAMSICGYFLIPQQLIFGHLIIFCNTMLITNSHKMRLSTAIFLAMWSVASTIFWSTVLSFGAYLYRRGEKVMESIKRHNWGHRKNRRYMNKFRRSCMLITLNFGRTFIIRRLTVLKFIKGLTVGTFRAMALSMKTH